MRLVVQYQHLLRFGETKLPLDACVLDGCERRCSGSAIVPADQHQVRMRFGDTRRHGAYSYLGYQFH